MFFEYNFFANTCCSEAESVVSEATTAVVSDTDRYAQVVGERSGTSHPSPGESAAILPPSKVNGMANSLVVFVSHFFIYAVEHPTNRR